MKKNSKDLNDILDALESIKENMSGIKDDISEIKKQLTALSLENAIVSDLDKKVDRIINNIKSRRGIEGPR